MARVAPKEKSRIKNKLKRQELFAKLRHQKNKEKHKMRASRAKEEKENPELKEERLKTNVPDTIESKRVFDETVGAEVEGEDDFSSYFDGREPKILLTTNANARKAAYEFFRCHDGNLP
jgi:ribosome production factor 1